MASWMDRLGARKPKSADQAKERLKLVLIHDRTDISPDTLDTLKNEILNVIAQHIDIDPDAVRISMAQDGREQRLVADIPLKSTAQRKRVG
ncbi:MAG: cell division topological specificity factor MinE [Anaerolineaceae bacterium]|nr:cell division topological specificity factor MinE [Anaerolineaceae bacterium]